MIIIPALDTIRTSRLQSIDSFPDEALLLYFQNQAKSHQWEHLFHCLISPAGFARFHAESVICVWKVLVCREKTVIYYCEMLQAAASGASGSTSHITKLGALSLSLLSLIKTTKSHHSAASPSGTYMHFQPGHLLRIYITKLRGSLAVSTGSLYNTQHYRLSRRAPLTHQHWTSPAGKGGVQH